MKLTIRHEIELPCDIAGLWITTQLFNKKISEITKKTIDSYMVQTDIGKLIIEAEIEL